MGLFLSRSLSRVAHLFSIVSFFVDLKVRLTVTTTLQDAPPLSGHTLTDSTTMAR